MSGPVWLVTCADMNDDGAASASRELLRALPKLDRLLDHPDLAAARERWGRGFVAHVLREQLDAMRHAILAGGPHAPEAHDLEDAALARHAMRTLEREHEPLPRILNGTGVLLNSGLGRAPVAGVAVEAMKRAGGYGLLEVDREAGDRLSRDTRAGRLLCALTGAEAALVVNNNAAATVLILSALGAGQEVICSRGEMVEIGGSYRIPDVMEASGCQLVEVGTTNKTHTRDYERAITDHTGALLVVHTSNYRIVGFTAAPPLSEVADLAHRHGLPAIHDLGSGSLLSPEELGFGDEPPVQHSFESGMDVVCMSGDKLLGGPQAGIILGKKEYVQRMRKHPLARALRVDKTTLAALEATLQLFFDRERLKQEHPVVRMLTQPADVLETRARALAEAAGSTLGPGTSLQPIALTSETGSGALPTLQIPSHGVSIHTTRCSPSKLGRALRFQTPGLFSRIVEDRVTIDLRTIFPDEDALIPDLIARTLEEIAPS